jgi:hypothetical protein
MNNEENSIMDHSNPSLHLSDLDFDLDTNEDSNTTIESNESWPPHNNHANLFNGEDHDFDSISNGSLHLSDLEDTDNSQSSGNTTLESNFTQGGGSRKKSKKSRKTNKSKKSKKVRKTKKSKKVRKTRKIKKSNKQKGGQKTLLQSIQLSEKQILPKDANPAL